MEQTIRSILKVSHEGKLELAWGVADQRWQSLIAMALLLRSVLRKRKSRLVVDEAWEVSNDG